MRIRNDTDYALASMRAIIARVAKEELNAAGRKRLRVTIEYRKRQGWYAAGADRGVSGHCGYGLLDLPGSPVIRVSRDGVDPIDFAFVVGHEIGHAKGMTHRMMRGSTRYDRVGTYRERYGWAAAFAIERVVRPVKPKPSRAEVLAREIERAMRREKEWRARQRRAETALKTYRRKIKDLARRHAAALSAEIAAA